MAAVRLRLPGPSSTVHRPACALLIALLAACAPADTSTTLTVTNWASFREQQLEAPQPQQPPVT